MSESRIDIEGLHEIGGVADGGVAVVDEVRDRAGATLGGLGRWGDAAAFDLHAERVSLALAQLARDVRSRANGMAGAEAVMLATPGKAGAPLPTVTDQQRRAWEQLRALVDRREAYRQIGGAPAGVLIDDMNGRIADLTAGFGRKDWLAVAHLDAGIDPELWRPDDGLVANDGIVQQIYRFYGDLVLDRPEVQWAGLAAVVGAAFYAGWQDLHVLRQVGDDSDRLEYLWRQLPLPELPDGVWDVVDFIDLIPMSPVDLSAMVAVDSLGWLEARMLSMQQEIFRDVGWQLSAYRYGGLAAVAAVAGPREPELVAAWTDIASGDPVRVTAGNEALLRREQEQVIQDDYEAIAAYRTPIGLMMSQVLTLLADHGLPGGRPYREVVTRQVEVPVVLPDAPALWPPWELAPVKVDRVEVTVPRGTVADFDDRWEWIERDLLPAYRALLDDPVTLRALLDTPLETRADAHRIFPGLPYDP